MSIELPILVHWLGFIYIAPEALLTFILNAQTCAFQKKKPKLEIYFTLSVPVSCVLLSVISYAKLQGVQAFYCISN